MRVAFVTTKTTRHEESTGTRRFERIAQLLADQGHDVTVFCSQWWDDYRNEVEIDGVNYRGVTLGTATSSFLTRIPALLATYRPDVIHVQPSPPKQVLAAKTGSSLARAPLVVEWFGDDDLMDDNRLTRMAATAGDSVIVPSEFVRTRVRELGATSEQTCVIPESIDSSLIDAGEPATDVDLVFAHPLDSTANLDDFILGLAELRERSWHATIIGDGPLREEFENEVAKFRIEEKVSFVGACDLERRIQLYRGAHAFVQTAYREYFANELLWALACGCIGIVEYQAESSAHELIENYERSFRVTDPQGLADAIVDAGDFDYRTRDRHWERYEHEAVIQQYIDEYTTIGAVEAVS
jgi:glycosyltransferase involved in cell wall biosynthesis